MQLLLEVPRQYSIFAPQSFHGERSDLPEASIEDVLRLPAPLYTAWFKLVHRLTLQLHCSTPNHCSVAISALTFAAELRFLSIEAVSECGGRGESEGEGKCGMCSFQTVKNCLVGKPHLIELQLHGVHVLPGDIIDFAAIMQQRSGLARSLESLTLCR